MQTAPGDVALEGPAAFSSEVLHRTGLGSMLPMVPARRGGRGGGGALCASQAW